MKLSAREIDDFIRAPGRAAAAVIYGTDAGQVRQRAAALAESWLGKNADPMARVEFSAEQLGDDATLLADELAAMSLMAPKRVVLVRDVGASLLPSIEEAVARRAPENFLIVYVGESLTSSDKLRLWAEKSPHAAAIACYKDEGSGLEQFIRDTLRGYGLRASNEATRLLANQLSGDRQIILNELEKLSLYVGDEVEEISLEDVLASVGENNDKSFDELNSAVAAGDMVGLCRLSDRLLMEGNHGLLLVRSVMRYIGKLEAISIKRESGMSVDAAIEGLRPPVFFKAKPLLKAHAVRWGTSACATALAKLQLLELDSKRYGDESITRLAHGLMDVANLAGPSKRAA
ncbi:MAG: DNA polymerase III subunit delta [Rickettsiales bacterium]|nr:DNA polymerase III subunit delta [Rickettsiales bacterium]